MKCAKCDHDIVITDAAVADAGSGVAPALQVRVDADPSAVFIKEPVYGSLRARVCTNCGYTELYCSNLSKLLLAQRRSLGMQVYDAQVEAESNSNAPARRHGPRKEPDYHGLLTFVDGVDRHGAKPPEGLPERFAVLTWGDADGRRTGPWPLLRAAVPQLAALVGAETVLAEWLTAVTYGFFGAPNPRDVEGTSAWDTLMKMEDPRLDVISPFPDRITFRVGERVLLQIVTEFWNKAKGPVPYMDSVTLSCFSGKPLAAELVTLFTAAANATAYKVDVTLGQ